MKDTPLPGAADEDEATRWLHGPGKTVRWPKSMASFPRLQPRLANVLQGLRIQLFGRSVTLQFRSDGDELVAESLVQP